MNEIMYIKELLIEFSYQNIKAKFYHYANIKY